MIRKFTALATALAFAAATLAPTTAAARDRHEGYGNRHYYGGYDRDYRRHRGHDDHGDAVAAGVIGLVLGLALGAAASESSPRRNNCSADYQRCAPPPGYYGGDEKPAYDSGYDPRYDDRGPYQGAYEDDYAGPPAQQCTRRERQWDRYANQYVTVDVPC